MKYLIVILLACVLGTQIAHAINSAARDVSRVEKAACRGKVVL